MTCRKWLIFLNWQLDDKFLLLLPQLNVLRDLWRSGWQASLTRDRLPKVLSKNISHLFSFPNTCVFFVKIIQHSVFLLVLQNSMVLIPGLMTNITKWRGVFQITYFCIIYLIFWVHKYAKCVHSEKLAKSLCTIRQLPETGCGLMDTSHTYWWWRSRCGVVVLSC